jgi:hypothetical protein
MLVALAKICGIVQVLTASIKHVPVSFDCKRICELINIICYLYHK